VQQIASSVRHVNESLDQIVWAINPRNDTLPNLIGFLGQSSMDFLRNAGIKCEIDLPDYPPKYVLTPEERHNLFLTVKEAINNVVRHAQAGEVQIHMNTDDHTLKIIIRDNGRGINGQPERHGSDGLHNMRQRMADIGGKCVIDAQPGVGTCVSLTFPIRSN
jgi:signal transduction histidine kinase